MVGLLGCILGSHRVDVRNINIWPSEKNFRQWSERPELNPIPKTQHIVLDAALFNTQNSKVRIKGKVEYSRKLSSTLSYTSV